MSGLEECLELDGGQSAEAVLAAGGGLVGWTREGAAFNGAAGVLPVEFAFADISATPNRVGHVVNAADSPVVSGYPASDTSFVFDPLWFPVLGEGVRAAATSPAFVLFLVALISP